MNRHLFSEELQGTTTEDVIQIGQIASLLRERDLDIRIQEAFPLSLLKKEDRLRINGAKSLVDAFERVNGEKSDLTEVLENMEFIGVSHDEQIIFNFKKEQTSASGVYEFTYEFLDQVFEMGKFGRYCIKNGYHDLLKDNLDRLFAEQKGLEKQYRFISKNGELFLRGFTSNRYQNYDNNIALYLSLFYIHRFAVKHNIEYRMTRAKLTDSALRIFLEDTAPISIPNIGKVYSGLVISNSEVRDNALTLEVRYRLVDENNSQNSFAVIPDLQDSVFTIYHTFSLDRVKEKINDVEKLRRSQESLIELIKGLKEMRTISSEALYSLYKRIIHNSNFQTGTKNRFKELYNDKIINNTHSLIQAFDKTNTITTDVEELVFLEKIYYDIIKEMVSRS